VLEAFVGEEIGINWHEINKVDAVTLLEVVDGRFTVRVDTHGGAIIHYNSAMILMAVEGETTVTHGGAAGKSKVELVVQMNSLVIPGRSTSFGVGVIF
jgi:hypothetical protein